jgi:hypothetical protein
LGVEEVKLIAHRVGLRRLRSWSKKGSVHLEPKGHVHVERITIENVRRE